MNEIERQTHWQKVYATKSENEVSWFQEDPAPSLDLIAATGISGAAAIIDIASPVEGHNDRGRRGKAKNGLRLRTIGGTEVTGRRRA